MKIIFSISPFAKDKVEVWLWKIDFDLKNLEF